MQDKRAIFIGGCGRSGTTMLGSALGAARNAIVTPESQFKLSVLNKLRHSTEPVQSKELYSGISQIERFRVLWEMRLSERIEREAGEADHTFARRFLFDVVDQYAARHDRNEWDVWVDHSPNNIRHAISLVEAFPDARILHIIRDGRSAAASVLALDWGPADPVQAAQWWMEAIAHGLAAERRYPDKVMSVKYESLTEDPEAELRRICEFAGLTFTAEMLYADSFKKPFYNQKQHSRVGTKISADKNESWRNTLSKKDLALFESRCGELLELLGYKAATTEADRRFSRLDLIRLRINSTIEKSRKRRRQRERVRKALARQAQS
ncbi:MAG: sulfotransferase family protein [Parvibaculum sp.]|uniref:sulfotransferase family protein n=1 Tax=Parvibaculum sp. TaxID=2024848 RepID=UPI00391D50E5